MSLIILILLLIIIIIIVALIINSKTRVAGIILAVIALTGIGIMAYINSGDASLLPVENVRKVLNSEHYEQIEHRAIDIKAFDTDVLKSINLLRFQKDKVKLSIYITEFNSYDDAMSNSSFKFQREFFRNLGYCRGGGGTINIKVCSERKNNEEVEFIHKKITGHSQ